MRVLVEGLGSIGRRHAENIERLGHCVVRADIYEDFRNILDKEKFDFVVICTPTYLHTTQCLELISRNIDFFCEKPIAHTLDDLAKLARTDTSRIISMVGCNLRFNTELRALHDSGLCQRAQVAHVRFGYDLRKWRPGIDVKTSYSANKSLGGGIILDAIHEYDYLCNFLMFGEPMSMKTIATCTKSVTVDSDDVVTSHIDFCNGKFAKVSLDYLSPFYERYCQFDTGVRTDIIVTDDDYQHEMRYFISHVKTHEQCMNNLSEATKLLTMVLESII